MNRGTRPDLRTATESYNGSRCEMWFATSR